MRRRFTCRVPSNSKSFALAAVLFFVVSLPFAHQAASAAERARECQIEEPAGGQGFQGFFGVGADERPPAGAFAPPASPPVEPAVPAVPPEDLPEPPTGEDLAASTREVREIFKLDELRSDKEKAQMISRLIKLAQNTPNDHNGRYVLLFEAARLAVGIDDLQMAITALDALARSHRVDSLDLKVKAIGAMSFSGKDEIEAAKPVVAALLGQALAEDRYQVADALIDSIGSEARDRRDFTYVKQLIEVKEQVDALAEQHAQAKETIARLESGEKEPADAVTAGRYYIVKGDWRKALPLLTAGEGKLTDAAKATLAGPSDPNALKALADEWLELADEESAIIKYRLTQRAIELYAAALPNLAGLNKLAVEKELETLVKAEPPMIAQLLTSAKAPVVATSVPVPAPIEPSASIELRARMTDDDIDGLVAHYTFDEDRPPFVRDSVGQMHGRAMSEPQWIEGVHGKSIAFDGKDDGVLFPNYNFGQEFTIVVWAKPAGAANGSEALVSNKLAQGRLPGWALQLHAGKPERLFFGMSNGIMSHRAAVTTAHTISRNRWNHFATTADAKGGRSRLFVDGFDHTEKANGRPNTPVVGPWTIGRKRDDPTQPGVFHPYHGALDDLRIYNRLLSADEIKRLYEATRP